MFEQIIQAGTGDVVIGITFPRYSTRTIKAMQYVRSQGAKVVAITDNPDNAPAKAADISLIARSDMASFVDSLAAPLSLINALIVAVGIRRREHMTSTFNRLEKIWEEYNVYDRMDEPEGSERENRDY
jgi:DNA-binding MurR/RpiR family transcriptional regulator